MDCFNLETAVEHVKWCSTAVSRFKDNARGQA